MANVQDQNVLISFTEDEARLLRYELSAALERATDEAQLFNGTEYGKQMIHKIGTMHLLEQRIRKTALDVKFERQQREATEA